MSFHYSAVDKDKFFFEHRMYIKFFNCIFGYEGIRGIAVYQVFCFRGFGLEWVASFLGNFGYNHVNNILFCGISVILGWFL